MLVGGFCRYAAAGGAVDEAELDEVGLVDVLDGLFFFANGDREGLEADGAFLEFDDEGLQDAVVHLVEAVIVDAEHFESGGGNFVSDL